MESTNFDKLKRCHALLDSLIGSGKFRFDKRKFATEVIDSVKELRNSISISFEPGMSVRTFHSLDSVAKTFIVQRIEQKATCTLVSVRELGKDRNARIYDCWLIPTIQD